MSDSIISALGFVETANELVYLGSARFPTRVHHSQEPILVAAIALARGNIPMEVVLQYASYRLVDMVLKRPALDQLEVESFLVACSAWLADPVPVRSYSGFHDILIKIIRENDLEEYFVFKTDRSHHFNIRPMGYDEYEHKKAFEVIVRAWRKNFRRLPEHRKMLLASILWLYRGCEDKTWLSRVSVEWPALHALQSMRSAGVLPDWARMVALYPGW